MELPNKIVTDLIKAVNGLSEKYACMLHGIEGEIEQAEKYKKY